MARTPGSWEAHGRGIFGGDLHIATATHPRDIEDCPSGRFPDYDTSIANARLIAAAPDLLEALESIFEELPTHSNDHQWMEDGLRQSVERARAAIAKATGEA